MKWRKALSQLLETLWIANILNEKRGQGFEDFFTDIAKQYWGEDFEPWKPQGAHGDFKCDGYHVSTKTVFQCYGPEQPNPATTASKIQKDFEGAKKHFNVRMKKWVFVYNQRAIPAASGKLIDNLRVQNPGIDIKVWLLDDIHGFALRLTPDQLAIVLPGIQGDHKVSEIMLRAIKEFVNERAAASEVAKVGDHLAHTNQITLDQTLGALGDDDRAIRRRILGYCKWFDPLTIQQGISLLTDRGFAEGAVSTNIERLNQTGLVRVTSFHILPQDDRICAEAADSLSEEFIEILEEA